MVRDICTDRFLLARKCEDACVDDTSVALDLLDTLIFHKDECVGMAANMIGICKRIIAFDNQGKYSLMLNPEIVSHSVICYVADEGCLSLIGTRKTKRFQTITVKWQDLNMRQIVNPFTGFTAQIIQHEIDHCNGILI